MTTKMPRAKRTAMMIGAMTFLFQDGFAGRRPSS
jgi:hypothetical protein